MAIGQHIRMRLVSDGPIAATPEARRIVARTVLELGRRAELLAFGLIDTHLHSATAGSRTEAGELARVVEIALQLRLRLGVPFERARIDPIESIWHLYNTFRYVLRQPEHHGLAWDPLREATSLPDLLGMRAIGRHTIPTVRRLLPRISRRDLLELIGVQDIEPVAGPVDRVVLATLAATALPRLNGLTPEVLTARRAAIEVIGGRLPVGAVAELLGVDRRSICRLVAARPVDAPTVLGIRRYLHFIAQLGGAALDEQRAFLESGVTAVCAGSARSR